MAAFSFERLLKVLVFAALLMTVYKGLLRTPEFASLIDSRRFFNGLVNDAENSLIMKERHLDFGDATAKAVRIRLEELESMGRTPDPDLVNAESLRRAVARRMAIRERDADYVVLAREKLDRMHALERDGWRMPLGLTPPPARPPGGRAVTARRMLGRAAIGLAAWRWPWPGSLSGSGPGISRLAPSGILQDQYREAAAYAARGLAHAEGLSFEDFDFLKYREVTRAPSHVWGAARCRAADGGTELAWIYLEWSSKRRQWLRNYSLLLATPDDEIFYTRGHPGQVDRAKLAIGKLLHQLARNVREVRDPPRRIARAPKTGGACIAGIFDVMTSTSSCVADAGSCAANPHAPAPGAEIRSPPAKAGRTRRIIPNHLAGAYRNAMRLSKRCELFNEVHAQIASQGINPYFRPIAKTWGSEVEVAGKRLVMIGSNDYLGLSHDARVMDASAKAVYAWGTGPAAPVS
jgi:hypothetical protein